MSDDLCIGFRVEGVAFGGKLSAQREIVFDDTVMDNYDLIVAVPVRMSIFLSGAAVCGPACVADSVQTGERLLTNDLFEIEQLTRSPAHFDARTVCHCKAGRVVTSVF